MDSPFGWCHNPFMPDRSGKRRPTDPNELARRIVDEATGSVDPEEEAPEEKPTKNPAAVELGRLGGLKGGKARAKKLTPEQLSEIGRKGADVRWKKPPK